MSLPILVKMVLCKSRGDTNDGWLWFWDDGLRIFRLDHQPACYWNSCILFHQVSIKKPQQKLTLCDLE